MSQWLLGHNIENKLRTNDVQIQDDVDFSSMLLSQPILRSLEKNGFKKPSPIQLRAIPMGRFGYDLIVKSKSGTGKTAVFAIIALEMIEIKDNNIQVLIIAPTREIAVQIETVIKTIGECIEGLKVKYFIGGIPLEDDIKKLKKCHIAVGAPGRLKALIKSGRLKTSSIRLFVLDEADKLLETSFQTDINYIYNKLPVRKQIVAASATYPNETKEFLSNYMKTPTVVTPNSDAPALIGIKQYVSVVKSHLNVVQQMNFKTNELIRVLQTIEFNQCVIFCNYQNRAETLSNNLNNLGWPCVHFSGAQDQKTRLEAINCLKEFKCRILSTTDLTARGIDAANLDLVINYEVPGDPETYLHRMGRAGRYGSTGVCVTLAADGAEVEKLQKILGKIGGINTFVWKIPTDDLTTNFWTNAETDKLFGVVDGTEQICNTLEELSVNQKQENTSVCSTSEKCNNPDFLNIENILQRVQNIEDTEKTILKSKLADLKPDAIIEMLSKGKLPQTKIDDGSNQEEIKNIENILHGFQQTDESQKSELKKELGNLNANSIIEMLTKGKIQKSKSKKVKSDEIDEKECRRNDQKNVQFENEADLFQKNNIAKKNIALYNITKLVVEQKSVTEENINCMKTLLESLKNDKSAVKLTSDPREFLENTMGVSLKNDDSRKSEENLDVVNDIPQWVTIREYEITESGHEICICHQNILTNCYSYAVSKTEKHWKDTLCKNHPYAEEKPHEKVVITKEEFLNECDEEMEEEYYEEDVDEEYYEENIDEEYYEENVDEEYYEEDGAEECYAENTQEIPENNICWDEDIFIKAYDYALHSEVLSGDVTFNDSSNDEEIAEDFANPVCGYGATQTYPHLMKQKSRKRSLEYVDSSNDNSVVDHQNTYESYFDYYHESLSQNAPYFYDVQSFEQFFDEWQKNVLEVRNYVQQDIYAKEVANKP